MGRYRAAQARPSPTILVVGLFAAVFFVLHFQWSLNNAPTAQAQVTKHLPSGLQQQTTTSGFTAAERIQAQIHPSAAANVGVEYPLETTSRELLERPEQQTRKTAHVATSSLPTATKSSALSSPPPMDRSKCLSKECLPEVAEKDYIPAYSDPDGGRVSMASMGLYPKHNLTLRIYVYTHKDADGLRELNTGLRMSLTVCSIGMWGTQTVLHKFLENSFVRTLDPHEADYFFVPAYPKCASDREKIPEDRLNKLYIKMVQSLPFFRRSGGRDHLFVFPSGRGATVFRDWKEHIAQSIFLSPEGHFTDNYAAQAPYFHTHKDIVIPGRLDLRKDGLMAAAKPQSDRNTLGIFFGTDQGKDPRIRLLELSRKHPSVINAACERSPRYFEFMGDSQFCFAPRGQSSWTLRFYESFFAGCIPVILADSIELPFADELDYSMFSIKWPMNQINENLIKYLQSVPLDVREVMVKRGEWVRCMFVYNVDASSCNAFSAILWQLEKRKRAFQQSREVFWLHDGQIVDRALQPLDSWNGPFASANIYNPQPTVKCSPACHEGGPNVCKSTEAGITCRGLKEEVAKCSA